jgi:hypothetical protein
MSPSPPIIGTACALTLISRAITDNQTTDGAAGSGGTAGQGIGDGTYFADGGVACLELFTGLNIFGNPASTSKRTCSGRSRFAHEGQHMSHLWQRSSRGAISLQRHCGDVAKRKVAICVSCLWKAPYKLGN